MPSEMSLRREADALTTVDRLGRTLTVRRPTALDTLRLFKAAGPVLAQNEPWLAIANLAYSVDAIDNVPIPAPVNEPQIEAIVLRLGDEGLDAVGRLLDREAPPSDLNAAVGNSPGTQS